MASSIAPYGFRESFPPKSKSHILHQSISTNGRDRNNKICMPRRNLGMPW